MNRSSSLHTRRIAQRFLFCAAVPLGVFATTANAHTYEQAQPPSPDTIAKQFPAIPSTTTRKTPTTTYATILPPRLAQTDAAITTTTTTATTTTAAPAPVEESVAVAEPVADTAAADAAEAGTTPDEGELAETGMISQDVLYAGLALLSLGAGFLLGVDTPETDRR